MKYFKKIVSIFSVLALMLSISSGLALAGPSVDTEKDSIVPEQNGTYDDPGHPGVKVRVFVHAPKEQLVAAPSFVCELSDPDSSATVGSAGWHLPANVTYQLNPSSVPTSVGSGNLSTIVGNGFSDWSSASGNKISFSRGADTTVDRSANDGKNIVAWGRTSGQALGVTYVRYNTSTGAVVDVDTIMNKKFAWSWANSDICANPTTYDAENILTHELGHWVGLDDVYTSDFVNNTMYGYGAKGEVKKNTLTTGDKAGAYHIYN